MSTQTVPDSSQAPLAMLNMITGFWVSRSLYTATSLGIADLLKDGPKTIAELASATGTHAGSLYRVMRALASVGVFQETAPGQFSTTALSATLESDVPGSLRAFAMAELGQEHYKAWEGLMHSVQTGEIAFDHVFGMPVWEYYSRRPEDAAVFNRAMSGVSGMVSAAVVSGYSFSDYRRIIDVGGGQGVFLGSMLQASPEATGVLFDDASVVQGARGFLDSSGLSGRVELAGGDFFKEVPAGGDLYTLKWILHDWNDEQSIRILQNVARAMNPNGRLLIIESILGPANAPDLAKLIDVNMLVMTGGRERTEAEFSELLAKAGFRMTRAIQTNSPAWCIEGVRA
jgi:SAM-dependent methyltransferase